MLGTRESLLLGIGRRLGFVAFQVKLCMDGQTPLDSFLPSESVTWRLCRQMLHGSSYHFSAEDWEEFRSWFEPEVNRAIHLDSIHLASLALGIAASPPGG